MTPQLRNLLVLLGGIAFVLILIILFFSSNSRFRLFINSLLDEKDSDEEKENPVSNRKSFRNFIPEPVERENKFRLPVREKKTTERPQRIPQIDAVEEDVRKSPESMVEMATLIQKSDDRLRIIESTGQSKLVDEYYELLFVTRKGKKIKIQCSRDAYDKIPFNQQGSLTYRRNVLVKFKYYEDIVYNS